MIKQFTRNSSPTFLQGKRGNSSGSSTDLIGIIANWNDPYCKIAFMCRICNKEQNIKYRGNWKAHFNTHSDIKPFNCDLCGKSFAQKIHLQRHNKSNHNM